MIFLHRALDQVHPLSQQAWEELVGLASCRAVGAGQHLLQAGTVARRIVFVLSGLLREYYVDSAGREFTRRFSQAGEFSGSLADLLSGGPCDSSIQVLEPCEFIELEWAGIDALAEQHPSLMKLMRRFAEGLYMRKMRREFEMLTLSAAQRLAQFTCDEPSLCKRLPGHLLASYLGITPVHLSRLRAASRSARSPTEPKERT